MEWFFTILLSLTSISLLVSFNVRSKTVAPGLRELLGLSQQRIRRLVKEFRRKTWHLVGLLIPAIYYIGLKWQFMDQRRMVMILFVLAVVCVVIDLMRFYVRPFREFYMKNLGRLLRKKEQEKFSGTTNFLIGSVLTIYWFSPITAITSTMCLTLGDMAAAIVGISMGETKLINGKSLQGTLACFFTCFFIAMIVFSHVEMSEYIAFCGAITATLAELMIVSIDDNLTIPIFAGLGFTFAMYRTWSFATLGAGIESSL